MKKTIDTFLGLGGVQLCMQSWKPDDGNSDAVVIMMHGGINHCDMEIYNQLATLLVENGLAVYSYDQRGFGRSEGKQMHLDNWEDVRGDFASFLRLVHAIEPDKSIFAFGISFGACQVMDQAIISPHLLNGIIAASFSTLPANIPRTTKGMIHFLGSIFPEKAIKTELQESFLGAKENMAGTRLWHDPLCPRNMTLGFAKILFMRQKELTDELQYITIPVLHLQGKDDVITLPDASIAQKIGTSDYTYREYDRTGHEILNGVNPKIVMRDISNWVKVKSLPHQ
jgi:lysophospholipase